MISSDNFTLFPWLHIRNGSVFGNLGSWFQLASSIIDLWSLHSGARAFRIHQREIRGAGIIYPEWRNTKICSQSSVAADDVSTQLHLLAPPLLSFHLQRLLLLWSRRSTKKATSFQVIFDLWSLCSEHCRIVKHNLDSVIFWSTWKLGTTWFTIPMLFFICSR